MLILWFLAKKPPKPLIFCNASAKWTRKTNIHQAKLDNFIIVKIRKRLMYWNWNRNKRKSGCHDFINKHKIANPNKETATDTDTAFSATVTWRLRVWQMKELKVYLRRRLHDRLLSKFFMYKFKLTLSEEEFERDVQVKIKYSTIDRNPLQNFNNLQLLRLLSSPLTNHSWSLVYIQQDLRSINLFWNPWQLVLPDRVACVIKNTAGSSEETASTFL